MQDGLTKKVERQSVDSTPRGLLESHRAVIVTLAGTTAGNEYELKQDRTTVGRGPGVDLAFDDVVVFLRAVGGVVVAVATVVRRVTAHAPQICLLQHNAKWANSSCQEAFQSILGGRVTGSFTLHCHQHGVGLMAQHDGIADWRYRRAVDDDVVECLTKVVQSQRELV